MKNEQLMLMIISLFGILFLLTLTIGMGQGFKEGAEYCFKHFVENETDRAYEVSSIEWDFSCEIINHETNESEIHYLNWNNLK